MLLEFKELTAEIDVQATRAFYDKRTAGNEAHERNHKTLMLQSFADDELNQLGITRLAPVWTTMPTYNKEFNVLRTYSNGPYYPLICKSLNYNDRDSKRAAVFGGELGDAAIMFTSLLSIYGTREFDELLPYYPNVLLFEFLSMDDWVLDEPVPESYCSLPEGASNAEFSERLCRRIEMMLHIIGAEYTPESPEHWDMLMRRAAEKFVKPRFHKQVFENWDCAGGNGLWCYLMSGGANNYLSAEAAEAAYDRCHASAYTLYSDHFATGGFHVTYGRLPTARQLRRFDDDFYVIPDDMSWMFARDHENYGPHFVY